MQSKDPLHGVTLERLLTEMVERHGWQRLSEVIRVNCFMYDPTIKSSLTFLRRTPWARQKLEKWYVRDLRELEREQAVELKRNQEEKG